MGYHEVQYLGSGALPEEFPVSSLKEFVVTGRSNVGKSSCINALLERKNMAYVGKTPGKTTRIHFYQRDEDFLLADVPGYGYAKRAKADLVDFGAMMEGYFDSRENLKGMIQLVDMRHEPTKDDLTMLAYAQNHHLPICVVCTKCDKTKKNDRTKLLQQIGEALGVPVSSLIAFSSETKEGLDQLEGFLANH